MTKPFWTRLGDILKNFLTDHTGESWAPGRLMGLIVFAIGQWATVYVILNLGSRHPPVTVGDWQVGLVALAAWEAAVCTSAVGLILGAAPADSANRWWQKKPEPATPAPVETTVAVTATMETN